MSPYRSLVEDAASLYQIPLALALELTGVESAWNPAATSPKGAMGLTQLMPGTARELGVTDPYDPAQNVEAGMRYLRQQYDEFGSWPLALAAYNAGPGRVREHQGVPPFPETQAYVSRLAPLAEDTSMQPPILPAASADIAMAPQAPQAPRQGLFEQLAMHPMFNLGLGILGANQGHYGALGPALGQGALLGLNNWQRMQAMQEKTGPQPTDDMREYALAVQQGYRGSFRDYLMDMRKAGATSVNVNTDDLGLKPKDRFGMERDLRSDFQSATKTSQGVLEAYSKWQAALTAEGGIRDVAAVTAFAKTLDPESVVREQEFATILNASGMRQKFFSYLEKLRTGQMVPPEQLAEMDKVVRALAQAARERLTTDWKVTAGTAAEYGLDPGRATGYASPEDILRRWEIKAMSGQAGKPSGMSDADWAELQRLRQEQGAL